MIGKCLLAFVITVAATNGVLAGVAPAYTITDLGNLGATGGGPFFPRYINENNQVVGVGPTGAPGGAFSAYSSLNGSPMTNIGGLGGNSVGFAVNNAGVIVGQSESAGVTTGTRWIGGVPAAVPGLAGPNNAVGGINNFGQIAGWMDAPSGGAVAYRLTGTTLENFGNLGGLVSDINGMNAEGRFVGNSQTAAGGFTSFRAFISSATGNSLIDLGVLGGSDNISLAFGINDAGVVIGTSSFFQPAPFVFTSRGFKWENGVMSEIPRPAGFEVLSPSGINNAGVVVGRVTPDAFSSADSAFIHADGQLQFLTDLLVPSLAGWRITNGWEINDGGFIAAEAVDPSGVVRNVLLNPIPEPAAFVWVVMGVAGLAVRRRL